MDDQPVGRRASVSVEYRERHDGTWLASTVVLIDGVEVLAKTGSGGYIGLPPGDLVSQQALVDPTQNPQQVLLYRCDCGEPGCGAVVARCYRVRDNVIWDRFASGNPPPVDLGAHRPADDAVMFSADDYELFASRVRELAARHPDAW